MMEPEIIRESEDDRDGSVAESAVETSSEAPQGNSEDQTTEVIANEEEVETPTKPNDFSDMLMQEWQADPAKKAILDRMIEKEAKRRVDERMGAEINFMEKDVRKMYKENPGKWKEDRQKVSDYDRMKAELDALRNQKSAPPDPSAKETDPADDSQAFAKAFVEKQNIDEAQTPIIAALVEAIEERMGKRLDKSVPDVLNKRSWEQEVNWVTGQNDYKTNRTLRALAHDYSHSEGLSPKEAYSRARADLKLTAPKTTIHQGKPNKGEPAFSREQSAGDVGDDDAYDGKDPFIKLKEKLRKQGR